MTEPTPIWPDLLGADDRGAYLAGAQCGKCGKVVLGHRTLCPSCWAEGAMAPTKIGRRGVVYSATRIHQAAAGFAVPFDAGYVDIEGGLRVFAHLGGALAPGVAVALEIGAIKTDGEGGVRSGPIYRATSGATKST